MGFSKFLVKLKAFGGCMGAPKPNTANSKTSANNSSNHGEDRNVYANHSSLLQQLEQEEEENNNVVAETSVSSEQVIEEPSNNNNNNNNVDVVVAQTNLSSQVLGEHWRFVSTGIQEELGGEGILEIIPEEEGYASANGEGNASASANGEGNANASANSGEGNANASASSGEGNQPDEEKPNCLAE